MADSSAQDNARVADREARGSGPAGAPLPAGAPARLGKFEIRAMLGEGAFGRVYRGYDSELRRDVAIKVPHTAGLDEEFRARFIREARAIATIHHPNVCPVFEVGTEGDLPYIVMRFVAGSTLAHVIDNLKTPMPIRNAVMIARKLALGMAAAHSQGVTHRDLKPANVLYDTANREVLITDFGLARVGGDINLTAKDSFLGTPAYTSPEQANRKIDQVGPLSDVYSLGVILYEMLTGDVPFNGSVMEVAIAHCITQPDPPSTRRPEIDARMDALVLKVMSKKPADRYPSARAFADALTDYLRPSDSAAGATGSAPELPSVALGGGREPESAVDTLAEKQAGRRTAPAFEVVLKAPAPIVELDEDEEAPATKSARRSAGRKSSKLSKNKKKKKKAASPLDVLMKNWMAVLGGVLGLVALVLLVVFLTRDRSPATVQKSTPEPEKTPVVNPVVQNPKKVDPKDDPTKHIVVVEDPNVAKLRQGLVDKWRVLSGPGVDVAALTKLKRYMYIKFDNNDIAELGLDSNDGLERTELRKDPTTQKQMGYIVTSSTGFEFTGALPPTFHGLRFGANMRAMTAELSGNNLTLTGKSGQIKLVRNTPR
jgi:serine/threonine protein kinase